MKAAPAGDKVAVSFPVSDIPEGPGSRLDVFLSKRLKGLSRSAVQGLIDKGEVLLRGRPAKASVRLLKEDLVVVHYPRVVEPEPFHKSLPILFEDERFLMIDKPADVICHPTGRVFENTVLAILRRQTAGAALHLAHRLDRETSGVLVLAKDPAAAACVQGQFERHEVKKEYWALASGVPLKRRFLVDAPIGAAEGEIRVRQEVRADGASAATEFSVLAASSQQCLIRARPRSGRLHQIRVHLAHAGHPVLGDKLYFGDGSAYLKAYRREFGAEDAAALGAPRQMLHARRLTLRHPDGHLIRVRAPLPADFTALARSSGILS